MTKFENLWTSEDKEYLLSNLNVANKYLAKNPNRSIKAIENFCARNKIKKSKIKKCPHCKGVL